VVVKGEKRMGALSGMREDVDVDVDIVVIRLLLPG
jgi:hypothetical protein